MRQVLAALALLALAGCHNDCSFFSRCNGNVLEVCGHADQIVNRKIESFPCAAPNAVCVQVDQGHDHTEAACAQSATHCDPAQPRACAGADLVTCDDTVSAPVLIACPDGGPCETFDGGARCTGS